MAPGMPAAPPPELAARLKALSAAEDFFAFFGVAFEPRVVQVNRLHILQRFRQYLQRAEELDARDACDEVSWYRHGRGCLERAYRDFVQSDARREKVFKVLREADGSRSISLATLRESVAVRRR